MPCSMHRPTPFRLLVGHREGALQINNAIQSLPGERTQGLRVVTLGCPIAEDIEVVDYLIRACSMRSAS